jgi:hypothetical protein
VEAVGGVDAARVTVGVTVSATAGREAASATDVSAAAAHAGTVSAKPASRSAWRSAGVRFTSASSGADE